MEKVKVTREIADAIEKTKHCFNLSAFVNFVNGDEGFNQKHHKILRNEYLPHDKDVLIHVLFYGYEVEPEFEVGDWVKSKHGKGIGTIKRINRMGYHTDFGLIADHDDIRHATLEEIAKEKERRWWKKHGRDIWELKEDDELFRGKTTFRVMGQGDETTTLFELNRPETDYISAKNEYLEKAYTVKFFAEDRKDV